MARWLPVSKITADPALQMRAEDDPALVTEYAERMKALAWPEWPPLQVLQDGDTYLLWDGFRRLAAAKLNGETKIRIEVTKGTRREALRRAVGANARHGKRRTNADKRKAVETILADPEWSKESNRDVSIMAVVSHTFVNNLRAETEGETGNVSTQKPKKSKGNRTKRPPVEAPATAPEPPAPPVESAPMAAPAKAPAVKAPPPKAPPKLSIVKPSTVPAGTVETAVKAAAESEPKTDKWERFGKALDELHAAMIALDVCDRHAAVQLFSRVKVSVIFGWQSTGGLGQPDDDSEGES